MIRCNGLLFGLVCLFARFYCQCGKKKTNKQTTKHKLHSLTLNFSIISIDNNNCYLFRLLPTFIVLSYIYAVIWYIRLTIFSCYLDHISANPLLPSEFVGFSVCVSVCECLLLLFFSSSLPNDFHSQFYVRSKIMFDLLLLFGLCVNLVWAGYATEAIRDIWQSELKPIISLGKELAQRSLKYCTPNGKLWAQSSV